ncbi:MAG: hypothetical protein KIS88_06060 [Anaerolineales bacterium]|nr:hypothetical protein [Anaerolineales bacterium]
MGVIYVNPSALDDSAQKLQYSGSYLGQASLILSAQSASAPSYEGQFGPWVGSIAAEARGQAKNIEKAVAELAVRVARKSAQFREVDGQAASQLMLMCNAAQELENGDSSVMGWPTLLSSTNHLLWAPLLAGLGLPFLAPFLLTTVTMGPGQEINLERDSKGVTKAEFKQQIYETNLFGGEDGAVATKWGGYKGSYAFGKFAAGVAAETPGNLGPYVEFSTVKFEGSVARGTREFGGALGGEVKLASAEAMLGARDGSFGGKIGVNVASVEGTAGMNLAGNYVGATAEIGLKWELGFSIGETTKIDFGPFSVGIRISEAIGL